MGLHGRKRCPKHAIKLTEQESRSNLSSRERERYQKALKRGQDRLGKLPKPEQVREWDSLAETSATLWQKDCHHGFREL